MSSTRPRTANITDVGQSTERRKKSTIIEKQSNPKPWVSNQKGQNTDAGKKKTKNKRNRPMHLQVHFAVPRIERTKISFIFGRTRPCGQARGPISRSRDPFAMLNMIDRGTMEPWNHRSLGGYSDISARACKLTWGPPRTDQESPRDPAQRKLSSSSLSLSWEQGMTACSGDRCLTLLRVLTEG